MEQHRTRPPHDGPRRGAPLPPQGRRDAAAPARPGPAARPGGPPSGPGPSVARQADHGDMQRRPAPARRNAPPPVPPVRRLPGPRLTGLGGGLFCAAVMPVIGAVDRLLFDSSLTLYGVLFLPVAALTALWVRVGDLVAAPVSVPIAFAVGLLTVADGGDGLSGHLVGLVTGLATQAGWLYGGTLVAGVIATVRRMRVLRRRAAQRRRTA
ncbi:DUF6542 domain-containing protein [Streptomyces sp. NPDC054775]|uniref:DUF6542 domain-containing protein n=1 Tax=Streptomyces sp. NPDC092129 TaxID=3366010 RepID=UPI0037FC9B14